MQAEKKRRFSRRFWNLQVFRQTLEEISTFQQKVFVKVKGIGVEGRGISQA